MITVWRWVAGAVGVGLAATGLAVVPATPADATPMAASTIDSECSTFAPVALTRVLDTRTGLGAPRGPIGPGHSVDVQVTLNPDSSVTAVLNLTAVAPTAGGYLTVYPTRFNRPTTSNLNFAPHQVVANEVVVSLGIDGKVTIFNGSAGTVQLVADLSGFFFHGSCYTPLNPTRVLDTRLGLGARRAPVGAGQSIDVQFAGRAGIPATAVAVAVNLTATAPTTSTYLTAYPTGQHRPGTSNLNLAPAQTSAVLAVAKLGTGGELTLYNNAGTTQLIADVVGWFSAGRRFTPITPTRIMDTRTEPINALDPSEGIGISDFHGTLPDNADTVIVSVTAVNPHGSGYLTVQSGTGVATRTSTLNFTAGHTVANLAIVDVSNVPRPDVVVTNHSTGRTDIVVDVFGWLTDLPSFTSSPLASDATVGMPYAYTLTTAGGLAEFTWSIRSGTFPPGLSLWGSNGLTPATIKGTPTTVGTYRFTLRVTDRRGRFSDQTLTLTVLP